MTEKLERRYGVWICLALTAAVAWVYWPVHRFEFINLDDPVYVTDNQVVQQGLASASARWAFSTLEAQFWHPLTWLSHMVDCELYGLKAGGHHVTNVLLHLANTLLLFGVLRRMTKALWRSALVAAVFGLHPLHVESVAWVAERKDVLSTLFWLLTLWAYGRYVEEREARSGKSEGGARESRRPSFWSRVGQSSTFYYGLALVFYVLGLMSKPMLVTVPFLLLLLDYWPLRRFELSALRSRPSTLLRLAWEKAPFFLVAGISSAVAYWAQRSGGAELVSESLPFGVRLANALISYVSYLEKTIWPSGLAVFYPYRSWGVPGLILAGAALVGMTLVAVRRLERAPYLAVGWFWYVGTLVPVIGLVQVGTHAMADRYTYVPLVGIFIAVVWGAAALLEKRGCGHWTGGLLSGALLIGCMGCTWFQLQHWQDSITLFKRTLAVTANNALAHNNLGNALAKIGRVDEAVGQYEQALRVDPEYFRAHNNLGAALFQRGQVAEAMGQYEEALRLKPNYVEARDNLGIALMRQGRLAEARGQYERVLAVDPKDADAHSNLGAVLVKEGRLGEAEGHFAEALRLRPKYSEPHYNWGRALLAQGRWGEAQGHFEQALALKPEDADAHMDLGVALFKQGRVVEAQGHFEDAVRLKPGYAAGRKQMEASLEGERRALEVIGQLERVLEVNPGDVAARVQMADALYALGQVAEAIKQYEEVVRQQPEQVEAHYKLGVALLRVGRVAEAVRHYGEVVRLRPEDREACHRMAWVLATCGDGAVRDGARAVELAERANRLAKGEDPGILDTLAAAYAEAGRFDEAVRTATTAMESAKEAGQAEAAREIGARLELYRAGKPYHTEAVRSH